MKHEAPATTALRPGTRIGHGSREAMVLSVDADPTAHVWIVYADNPDGDAMVHREQLSEPCAICGHDYEPTVGLATEVGRPEGGLLD